MSAVIDDDENPYPLSDEERMEDFVFFVDTFALMLAKLAMAKLATRSDAPNHCIELGYN